jgi:hypothetical protein
MADDYNGTPLPENQNPEPGSGDQNDNIPDWMKEAGWETSSGTFDESKPVFDDLDGEEEEIVPADIPAWLEDAAPEGFSSDPNATPAFEGLDVDEPFITTGDLVPPPSMQPPAKEVEPDQKDEPVKSAAAGGFDIPTWLENLELDEDSQETAVAWLENMPESLRATEEELQAAKEIPTEEPEFIEEPVDELAWVDEDTLESDQPAPSAEDDLATLSEDLIASELIPEARDPDQIFKQDEIESLESELPSWLKELGDDQPDPQTIEEAQAAPPSEELDIQPESQEETMPDWLRTTEDTELTETQESSTVETEAPTSDEAGDIPEWLTEFEDSPPDTAEEEESLEWLDSLATEKPAPETFMPAPAEDVVEPPSLDEPEETIQVEPADLGDDILRPEGVSSTDETLNTQVPEWLSKIGDTGELEEQEAASSEADRITEDREPASSVEDFESPDAWLEQISEEPPDVSRDEIASQESEVIDWLDEMAGLQEDVSDDVIEDLQGEVSADDLADIQESIADLAPEETPPIELETAKYLPQDEPAEEERSGDLPDWLSELREEEDDQSLSLEEAIRHSDHDLNEAEVDFLNKVEEKQEDDADWLSKLDQVESEPDFEPFTSDIDLEAQEEEPTEEQPISGGILDRLVDTAEFKGVEEIPQWLSDLKEEEDPQETAVLWLQQFVNQGNAVDIKNEIKRYTDELDPGDSIPRWMEDLKNEEDPQTTAMLWLEKLSAARQTQAPPSPPSAEEEDSGWLADLEREAADSPPSEEIEEIKNFHDADNGWLADLEIDEKLKTTEGEIPDWSKSEDIPPEEAEPPWLKATSPLEGDFFTDELSGGEEKEVEIPEWLAGYAEGERPEETQEQEEGEEEEYTWLSATETPAALRTPLDLNSAAISQLEGILGISHQIAWGIVTYREKHGPYHDFSDLKNVPEITDDQTIEILKPEVFISEIPQEEEIPTPAETPKPVPPTPEPKPAKKAVVTENFEEILVTARTKIGEGLISDATDLYSSLIKKKKFLTESIEDLKNASLDHPLEISIHKTLGEAYMQQDMLDEALEAYSKAEDLLS